MKKQEKSEKECNQLVQEELNKNITLLNTAEQRRPNGSIGTQGFTETSFINLARFISDKLNLNIPTPRKKGEIEIPAELNLNESASNRPSEITQIIDFLKNIHCFIG